MALLTTFGSIEKIKKAEVTELADIESMDLKSAENVYNYFRSNKEL